jgi:hypothetical protein
MRRIIFNKKQYIRDGIRKLRPTMEEKKAVNLNNILSEQ